MKETKILAALGQVDDAYIAEAAPVQRKRWGWIKWVATAACLALIVVGGAAGVPSRNNRGFAAHANFAVGPFKRRQG